MPKPFQINGINHLGIAAKDPAKFRWFFGTVLGLKHLGDEVVSEQNTLTGMFRSSGAENIGEPRIELLEPALGASDSPIAKYLQKRGGGIHHLAFSVSSVMQAIEHAQSHGVRLIDQTPRLGAHNTRVAFVHPESTGGVLVEFVEE